MIAGGLLLDRARDGHAHGSAGRFLIVDDSGSTAGLDSSPCNRWPRVDRLTGWVKCHAPGARRLAKAAPDRGAVVCRGGSGRVDARRLRKRSVDG